MTVSPLLVDRRKSALVIVLIALLVGGLALWTDLTGALNRAIEPARFGLVSRAASRQVVVVEMDAASAAAIRRWPWSRTNYAPVIDALRKAGATSIVFDVDFSSPSDPAGDRAMAAALARADGLVVLPTFGQQAGADDVRTFDALPLAAFRPHAAMASVSVAPGSDGVVRDMPFGTITAGTPRPSLSSYIAGRSGRADTMFPIDMSIDPQTIPRLSFVAVRDGRFDPATVRGRQVLIGATAVEMGDRYGTSRHGVVPGVVIQAMAAETLLRSVPSAGSPAHTFPVAALLALLLALARTPTALAVRAAAATTAYVTAVLAAQYLLAFYLPIAGGLIVLGIAGGLALARLLLQQFQSLRLMDEATGLPNRRAMMRPAAQRSDHATVVVQITNFEDLVAVLGVTSEIDAVQRVADRLTLVAAENQVFRITNRSLAFRLPVDEADETLEGLRAILLQPVEVAGRRIDVVCALGLAHNRGASADVVLHEAARAAEIAGDTGVFWRRAETDVGAIERSLTLMGELDAAIAAHGLRTYYQPKLDLRTGTVVSAEALVRWPHPERGFIPPDAFIPMAEQTDRIAPLTLFVLSQVLADLAALRSDGHALTCAVNISAKLLAAASFTAEVERIVAASAVPPSALVFEVTESAAMSDPEAAISALARFRALGIAVSMDDYGTGQSTLTYLRQLPLNELKIDRSFVQHAHRNRNDGLLVRSTIDLAHELGLKVVAEGVEDVECLDFLRSIGCDMVQGYVVSRPLPRDDFAAFVASIEAGTATDRRAQG